MKNLIGSILNDPMSSLSLIFTAEPDKVRDSVEVAPQNHKVLMENNRVRVLEYRIRPGEKIALHSHCPAVVYPLNDCCLRFNFSGRNMEQNMQAGKVMWLEPQSHGEENTGPAEAAIILVELK